MADADPIDPHDPLRGLVRRPSGVVIPMTSRHARSAHRLGGPVDCDVCGKQLNGVAWIVDHVARCSL